ncbi:MAG: Dabb family protein [Pseudomonadota bacterium]
MIRHIVLTRFRADVTDDTITAIYTGLAQVTDAMAGAGNFAGGRSQSPEQIERGYMHGFTVDFKHWDDLRAYADDPAHQALGGQIVANAEGGLDGVLVLDIEF